MQLGPIKELPQKEDGVLANCCPREELLKRETSLASSVIRRPMGFVIRRAHREEGIVCDREV